MLFEPVASIALARRQGAGGEQSGERFTGAGPNTTTGAAKKRGGIRVDTWENTLKDGVMPLKLCGRPLIATSALPRKVKSGNRKNSGKRRPKNKKGGTPEAWEHTMAGLFIRSYLQQHFCFNMIIRKREDCGLIYQIIYSNQESEMPEKASIKAS